MSRLEEYRKFFEHYDYLKESRIMASRHLSDDDRKSFVRDVLDCINNGKFSIVDRDVNVEFIIRNKITEPVAIKIIKYYLNTDSVIGVVNNISRNYRGRVNDDLYICELSIDRPKMYIYLKIQYLEGGKMQAISFHDQDEPIFVDYYRAQDYVDNTFNETVADRWKRTFNSKSDIEIVRSSVQRNIVRFEFDDSVYIDYNMKNDIAHSIPKDMGLNYEKMKKSAIWNRNIISFKIITKSYLE